MAEIFRFLTLRTRWLTHTSLWVNLTVLLGYLLVLVLGVWASVSGYREINLLIIFVLLFILLAAAFNLTAILGAKLVGVISGIMAAADADDLSQQISAGVVRMSSAYWKNVFGFITWALIPFMYLLLFPVEHAGIAFGTLAMVIMVYLISSTFRIGDGRVAKAIVYYTAVLGLLFFMGTWVITGIALPFYHDTVLNKTEVKVADLTQQMQDKAHKADLARIQALYGTRASRLETISQLKAKMEDGTASAVEQKQLKGLQKDEKEFASLLDKHKGPLGRGGYPKEDRHYLVEVIVEEKEGVEAKQDEALHPGADIPGAENSALASQGTGGYIIEPGIWNITSDEDGKPVQWNMVVSGDKLTLTSTANPLTMTLERTAPNKYAGKWKSGYHNNEIPVEVRFITAAKAEGKLDINRAKPFTLRKV